MHRTTIRPGRVRALSALAGAVAGGLVAAAVLVVAPAQAQLAIPVSCTSGKTVLEWDHVAYDLDGTCGVVVVAADDTTVSMPAATRLVVRGQHNEVDAKPITELVVRGRDNRVTTPSVRYLELASPGSEVAAEGLVEEARLSRSRGTLTARQVSDLVMRGDRHEVRARRGYDARVPGDHNRLAFRRLDALRVGGDRNQVVVRRGETVVRATGAHNRIRVNRRG